MKWIPGTLLSLSLLTVGCSDPVAPATPTPVPPTITDTFTGTLVVLGLNTHPFVVTQVGDVSIALTDMTPSAAVNLGVGTAGATGCSVIRFVTAVAGSTPQIVGTASTTGNFCVSVSDAGNLVEPVTYTIVVRHP